MGPFGAPNEWLEWLDTTRGKAAAATPRLQKYHHYLEVYERHLSRFRRRDHVRLVEIGINDGGSLAMWRWYLGGGAELWGADINNRTKVYTGSAAYGRPKGMYEPLRPPNASHGLSASLGALAYACLASSLAVSSAIRAPRPSGRR